ncbi:MAG: hypothetical protein GY822_23530 [Deltaproteobacteria bacterium]|nr:hypothetical protein [Deltaproteobacteria bacterium]
MIPKNMRVFIASTPVHMGRSFGGLEKIVSDLGHEAECRVAGAIAGPSSHRTGLDKRRHTH